jgi:hypothetical protein
MKEENKMTEENQRVEVEKMEQSLDFPAIGYGLEAIVLGACGVYCHCANVQYHDLPIGLPFDLPLSLPLIGASIVAGVGALLFGAASVYHKAKEKKQEQKDGELKLIEAVREVYSRPVTEESKAEYNIIMSYLGEYMDNLG